MGRFVFFNNEYSIVVDERKITNNSLQEIDRISNSMVSIETNQHGSWLKVSDKVDSIYINKKNINSRLLQLKENDLCIISFDGYTFCVLFCATNHLS